MTTVHQAFHPGEKAIHNLLRLQTPRQNPTATGLPPHFAARLAASPLLALGALDAAGNAWTTLLGGAPGVAQPLSLGAHGILGVGASGVTTFDPVLEALLGRDEGEEEPYHISREELEGGGGRLVGGLGIDLALRDRVKFGGRLVAGKVDGDESSVEMAVLVEESLGNCPKYLNKKSIRPHTTSSPKLVGDKLPLPKEAVDLLGKADMFFLSSTDGLGGMDTNHRGGPPGFVRILHDDEEDGTVLVYPEYSGNNLYQTLGNLHLRPKVGICVPDFDTGDVLYLTGDTEILFGSGKLMPHTKLAVRIHVRDMRFVSDGLGFRGELGERSGYNPPVRRLAVEMSEDGVLPREETQMKAMLVGREILTPTIARFTFKLDEAATWVAGQHVTLDFSEELDVGWSHMRDDDPTSLNDDFVRTFTISNTPPPAGHSGDVEVQITARKHGPVTGLLWRWNLRVPLEIGVVGFGGQEGFRISTALKRDEKEVVFVAGGAGITPLLAQAPGLLAAAETGDGKCFELLWSLRDEDLAFAVDVFGRIPGLASRTRLFVTGQVLNEEVVKKLEGLGAKIGIGRVTQADVLAVGERGKRKYYLCTGSEVLKALLDWLEGEDIVYESFAY